MRKVLILANNEIGLYKFRKELIIELLKDNEVFVSLPDGNFVRKLSDMGCKFVDTQIDRRGANPIADFKLMLNYKKIIGKIKPDVVLTYTIKPNIYGGLICGNKGIPYIANITGLGTAIENNGFIQKLTLLLYKLALKNAACVFFQNKGNAEFLNSKKIITRKQRIIPGSGVNLSHYGLLDYPEDDVINFLFISRVMKEKGIDQYLDAAKHIRKKHINTRFHILGFCEEDYQTELAKLQEEGIVQYHGMQSDVREFHRISHCTIHPTYYPEGMSNVLLESAACGRPIITTNRSGCKEIIDDDINGFIVKEKNSQDLIDKIEKFIQLSNKERKQMGLAGRTKVEKEFNRQIVIDKYLEEINTE